MDKENKVEPNHANNIDITAVEFTPTKKKEEQVIHKESNSIQT